MTSTIGAAVFASGEGTNAEALVRHAQTRPDALAIPCGITDQPRAGVIARLSGLGVPVHVLPFARRASETVTEAKASHEAAILGKLAPYAVEWIFLAGYMRILSSDFVSRFVRPGEPRSRILNIHPALLPEFPGLDAYRRAFRAGVPRSGVTVHFVDAGVDTGPILLQRTFPRLPGDTLESFIARGKTLEHTLYAEAVDRVIRGAPIRWPP
ncbi:MAG: phosphoribosylglycinamide formyltransferase [Pseudomonadota bacterium]